MDAALAPGPTGSAARPDSVVVGRTAELAAVRELVDRVAAGRGGALLVAGEAGIGKTRLLDEVLAHAAGRELPVLAGRAVPGGGPFRAVAEAVIGLLDDPEHARRPELRPYRSALGRLLPSWVAPGPTPGPGVAADPVVVLAEGLLRLLRVGLGDASGGVLALEDLHWADHDTLALVERLASAAADAPVLVAATARDDAPTSAAQRLAAVPGVVVLRPRRLDEREVAALVAARGGEVSAEQVRRLHERSDGLPLAVAELLARPGTAVPPTLAALVAERLAGLDEPARAVLAAAAVVGPELDWRLLAPVAEVPEAGVLRALRAAADRALLVADGPALRWRHALTRDAVRATLLPPERAVLAGRAARVLAERAGPDDELRAAELFVEAGEPDAAVGLLLPLADRAAARGALRSAEALLGTAAGIAGGSALAAAITTERVRVLTLIGRTAEALALGRAVLDTLTGDDHAELCLRLARTAVTAGAWDDVETYVARAGRPGDPRSLVLRADAAFGAGRLADAVGLATEAIARAEQVVDGQVADGQLGGGSGGEPEEPAATSRPRPAGGPTAAAALCEALGVAGRLAWRTDLDVSEALARRATQVAAEHGLLPWRAVAAFQLGMVRMLRTGDTGPVDRARELALDAGMLGQVAAIDYVRSDHAWLVDGPGAGLAIARAADDLVRTLRLPRRAFSPGAIVEALDALDALVTGRATAASTRARDAAVAAERVGGPPLELVLRAVTALVEHDLPAAATELEGTARALLHGSALTPPLVHLGAYALATAAVGAAPAVDVRTAAAAQVRANRGAFAWADAVVHGRAGRPREAAALFAEGDAALAAVPWWRRLLRSVVLGCAVVDGWGDPVPLLRADLAAHEQAGAPGLARTCRDLLRRAGAPTRRRRAGAAVPPRLRARGITAREAEVLGLVVAGLTNAQIAERLFLSSRTVDTHVANLLAKTGAPGRTQLGSWADAAQ